MKKQKIEKKLKEKREIYEKKIDQMKEMQSNFQTIKTEAINLEGQISALEGILEDK